MPNIKRALHNVERLKQCQLALCKKELDANKKLTETINKRTTKLRVKLMNKEIDMAAFTKEMDAIQAKMLDSVQTQKVIGCSVKKCNKEYRTIIKEIASSLKPKNAELYKAGMALSKNQGASADDFIAFLKRVMELQVKMMWK